MTEHTDIVALATIHFAPRRYSAGDKAVVEALIAEIERLRDEARRASEYAAPVAPDKPFRWWQNLTGGGR